MNYYNEFEPYAAEWLRNLIKAGHIPAGDVDTRSITDVRPDDLKKYTQCHFFAGIGGWPLALSLAGWDASRPVWTGSCPCQPFSTAGKQKGGADDRHLWPVWFNLIRECRPPAIFGEQVASAVSHGWLDGVFVDLEREDYAAGAAVLPACAIDAPHKRDRLWFMAYTQNSIGRSGQFIEEKKTIRTSRDNEPVGSGFGYRPMGNALHPRSQGQHGHVEERNEPGRDGKKQNGSIAPTGFWDDHEWIICGDGKARRIPSAQSGIRILAHGVPARVGKLRAGGNAIVPEEAARFIVASELARVA